MTRRATRRRTDNRVALALAAAHRELAILERHRDRARAGLAELRAVIDGERSAGRDPMQAEAAVYQAQAAQLADLEVILEERRTDLGFAQTPVRTVDPVIDQHLTEIGL